ncbi:MAG: RNA polymerase factor sigma-54 [Hyphomicrobiales bacterium]|nr:RNA polymerase factor sigma-54 [Hyphomicrobiales bacterium]
MAFAVKLELRQRQALVVTPQLQQAIKLLQLSNLDLQNYVERELEQNPLLELDAAPAFDAAVEDHEPAPATDTFADVAAAMTADLPLAETMASAYDGDDRDGDGWASARITGAPADDGGSRDYESHARSLGEHLTEQFDLAVPSMRLRIIARHLIDMIDEAGYLRGELETVAETLGAPLREVERTLSIVQGLEPVGVGARSLSECLALQLRERNRLDPAMQAILDNLGLVAARDMAKLRRVSGLSLDEVEEAVREIKQLSPKPGLAFGRTVAPPVAPDVFVRRRKGGGWIVEINQETLPKLLINHHYQAIVHGAVKSDADKTFLSTCVSSANWLVKSLDQRTRTILKVAQEIVAQQEGFLVHGVRHLKPLNLRDVASEIKMHESTVSRVTSNKFMATPRGVFELKYFFTSAIAAAGRGEDHSSEAVRHRIKALIDAERPEAILSDDQIVARLRADGVDIARRTVAKYREAMRISSSVQRRRQKRMQFAGGV